MEVLDEQLQIVLGNWASPTGDETFSFSGKHYQLERLDAQPKPIQRPHPPLLIGGAAGPLASRLAASYADQYNTVSASLDQVRERHARIVQACERIGREPIPFSVMGPVVAGRDDNDLRTRATRTAQFRGMDADAILRDPPEGWIVGTLEQVAAQLRELEQAGVSRVLCQHMPHDDLEFVEILGRELAPLVA